MIMLTLFRVVAAYRL